MKTTTTIRVIQFSDCHLSADGSQTWYERNPVTCLQQVLHAIRNNGDTGNLLIATGDLSHDGSQASYEKLASTFHELDTTIYSLPGNHDNINVMTDHLHVSAYLVTGNWMIIMINTVLPGDEGGFVNDSEIERIKLIQSRHPDKFILYAMHHPPVNIGSHWIDNMSIRNGDELIAVISAHSNSRAIICGHVHQEHSLDIGAIQVHTCPSTCHQFMPDSHALTIDTIDPGYRWLDLLEDGTIRTGVTRVPVQEAAS